jgi:hypothetical protein
MTMLHINGRETYIDRYIYTHGNFHCGGLWKMEDFLSSHGSLNWNKLEHLVFYLQYIALLVGEITINHDFLILDKPTALFWRTKILQ